MTVLKTCLDTCAPWGERGFVQHFLKETLIKLIPFMVRQAHHERNQLLVVRPELVEGLNQSFLKPIE
jgi:glycerol-3-phosphate dehydrogenase (NAD(P)+)